MRGYDIKRDIDWARENLENVFRKFFPESTIRRTGENSWVAENCGALSKIEIEIRDGKLYCRTQRGGSGDPSDTIRRYNSFVKEITGLETLITTKVPGGLRRYRKLAGSKG